MATLDFWQILNLINTEFPQYVSILGKPGIMDVFLRYATAKSSGVNPWTPDQLQAELLKTPYYQQNTDKERSYDLLAATDPATARRQAEITQRTINDISAELGIKLDGTGGGINTPAFSFFMQALRNGWDATEIRYRMISTVNKTNDGGGLLGSTAAHVKNMANDYGVPLGDWAVMGWAQQLIRGSMDDAGIQGYLIKQAKSLFPGLATALDQGITVKQYADPYIQLATQELDTNPDDIKFTDQKWMAALNQIDPKTGVRTSMALDSWLAKIRSDPVYGYDTTAQGRQSATQLASALQQKMGNAA